MRLLRCVGLMLDLHQAEPDTRSPRRRPTNDTVSVARCPKCGGELVARMARGRPAFWCRCPVRRGLAIGA
jgi:predicted RNA-binding Zn-ribbon protein involved in translation (DUF1610 family)